MKDERGITLIEVMGAVLLLGIIVIAFLNVSGYSLTSGIKIDHREEANRIAVEQLGIYRARYADPTSTDANKVLTINSVSQGFTQITEGPYTGDGNYRVLVQQGPMGTTAANAYLSTNVKANKITVEGVVLAKNTAATPNSYVPRLMLVTVSWDGG